MKKMPAVIIMVILVFLASGFAVAKHVTGLNSIADKFIPAPMPTHRTQDFYKWTVSEAERIIRAAAEEVNSEISVHESSETLAIQVKSPDAFKFFVKVYKDKEKFESESEKIEKSFRTLKKSNLIALFPSHLSEENIELANKFFAGIEKNRGE